MMEKNEERERTRRNEVDVEFCPIGGLAHDVAAMAIHELRRVPWRSMSEA